ncbi:unnamed protein product [Protopolystoma xenopodis]|uniref:Uncharacterized protein n=1 Tax=Protopolystoma xenopodis TaxID=117903 RepID=A0A3S5CJH0_9PLAT|nr:unnamed protein product [Protopolystoma xenopodis]
MASRDDDAFIALTSSPVSIVSVDCQRPDPVLRYLSSWPTESDQHESVRPSVFPSANASRSETHRQPVKGASRLRKSSVQIASLQRVNTSTGWHSNKPRPTYSFRDDNRPGRQPKPDGDKERCWSGDESELAISRYGKRAEGAGGMPENLEASLFRRTNGMSRSQEIRGEKDHPGREACSNNTEDKSSQESYELQLVPMTFKKVLQSSSHLGWSQMMQMKEEARSSGHFGKSAKDKQIGRENSPTQKVRRKIARTPISQGDKRIIFEPKENGTKIVMMASVFSIFQLNGHLCH